VRARVRTDLGRWVAASSLPVMDGGAAETYRLRLQIGRFFRGRVLTLVVVLREAALSLLGDGAGVAPAWVVVEDRASGQRRWRVSAGRGIGVGEHLLATMEADQRRMTAAEFEQTWRK
jgi:hypothetical protein